MKLSTTELTSFHLTENHIMKRFHTSYNYEKMLFVYERLIIDSLVLDRNCRFVVNFNEDLIYNYNEDYFQKIYTLKECKEQILSFPSYYENYLKFFCNPLLQDFFFNRIIQKHFENQAKAFYHQNVLKSISSGMKVESSEENNQNKHSIIKVYDESESNKKRNEIIFSDSERYKIENDSIITLSNIYNNSNRTISLSDASSFSNKQSNQNTIHEIIDMIEKKKENKLLKKVMYNKSSKPFLSLYKNKNIIINKNKIKNKGLKITTKYQTHLEKINPKATSPFKRNASYTNLNNTNMFKIKKINNNPIKLQNHIRKTNSIDNLLSHQSNAVYTKKIARSSTLLHKNINDHILKISFSMLFHTSGGNCPSQRGKNKKKPPPINNKIKLLKLVPTRSRNINKGNEIVSSKSMKLLSNTHSRNKPKPSLFASKSQIKNTKNHERINHHSVYQIKRKLI